MEAKRCYTRDDSGGSDWCSPEYMSAVLDLGLEDCRRFINGPEHSNNHGLYMTATTARLFYKTDLSAKAEKESV